MKNIISTNNEETLSVPVTNKLNFQTLLKRKEKSMFENILPQKLFNIINYETFWPIEYRLYTATHPLCSSSVRH